MNLLAAARRVSGATGFASDFPGASVRYATWTSDSALAEPVAHRAKRTTFCLQVRTGHTITVSFSIRRLASAQCHLLWR